MERLNYHHLLYFYTVAREGSVARASLRLGLKQPTVSAQIHALETNLARKLLQRSGRGLKITPAGETVLRYAESIFGLGSEMLFELHGHPDAAPKLSVGVSSSLPPPLIAPLLNSLFALEPRYLMTISEAAPDTLAAQVASARLSFAFTDIQLTGPSETLHNRMLLQSSIEVFAPASLARKMRVDFPLRLAGAPVIMPPPGALRREVESWLAARKLTVRTIAEMPRPESHATAARAAIFASSTQREELKKSHGLAPAGELEGSRWRLFLVAAKGASHPSLRAVIRAAKGMQ